MRRDSLLDGPDVKRLLQAAQREAEQIGRLGDGAINELKKWVATLLQMGDAAKTIELARKVAADRAAHASSQTRAHIEAVGQSFERLRKSLGLPAGREGAERLAYVLGWSFRILRAKLATERARQRNDRPGPQSFRGPGRR